jgi:hypothetical protein
VSYCSQQISFRYRKRHSNDNSKIRHHNRKIYMFSNSTAVIFLGVRTYILPDSENYYQKGISVGTTPLTLKYYQGLVGKVQTACRCNGLLRSSYHFLLVTHSWRCITMGQHLWNASSYIRLITRVIIDFVALIFSIKFEARRRISIAVWRNPLVSAHRKCVDVNLSSVLLNISVKSEVQPWWCYLKLWYWTWGL